jgi:hypothetical protein
MALKIVFVVITDWLLIQICENGKFSVVLGVRLQIEFNTLSLCDKMNAEFLQ